MIEHLVLKVKSDNDYDMLINMDNVLFSRISHEGGYILTFIEGTELRLSWKEYDRLNKAMETVSE
jgi:hypothetical protein